MIAIIRFWGLPALLLIPVLALAQGSRTICKFTDGPLKGKYRDYAPQAPLKVGSPCHDTGSTGVVVAKADGPIDKPMTKLKCKFDKGILAGMAVDFVNVPGARPVEVGTPCTDGVNSSGIVVE